MKILTDIGILGGILFALSWAGLFTLFVLAWIADKRGPQPMHPAAPSWPDDEIDVPDFLKDGHA